MSTNADLLARGLAALDLEPHGALYDSLSCYVAELELWNPAYGLVNASGEELIVKHILDSLAPWKIVSDLLDRFDEAAGAAAATGDITAGAAVTGVATGRACLTDLGTGAGLPGIPLALALPDRHVRLVERMGKRVTFLESQKARIGLRNVEIVESEVERAPGPHQVAVFRAFRPFAEIKLFRALWSRTAPGGAFLAYKGKKANALAELEALGGDPALGEAAKAATVVPLWVPFLDEERCAAILMKPFSRKDYLPGN